MRNGKADGLQVARRVALGAGVLGLVALSGGPALAAAGDPDTTFSTDGRAALGNGPEVANDVLVTDAGKVLLVGRGSLAEGQPQFTLARLTGGGSRDAAFGDNGVVMTQFPVGEIQKSWALGAASQGDGRIVAAGCAACYTPSSVFALARYRAGGAPDPTFGSDGRVTTHWTGPARANDVALQADGRAVAVGVSQGAVAIARYRTAGGLDPTFAGDGKVRTSLRDGKAAGIAVAIQDDGKIVVVGTARGGTRFLALRYRAGGDLDTSFSRNGILRSALGSTAAAAADVAILDSGEIVAAATADGTYSAVRLTSTGAFDTTFGGGDGITTGAGPGGAGNDAALAVAVQGDGSVLVAGTSTVGLFEHGALARFLSDGVLDASFGGDGVVDDLFAQDFSCANALAIQGDGKILAAGWGGPKTQYARFMAARVLAA